MSGERNRALVRRFWEGLVSTGNLALADELLARGFIVHYAGNPPMDRDGFLRFLGALRVAFPDVRASVEALLAERDEVAVRWTWHGTHRGSFMGIPATGKPVTGSGVGIFRIADDRIVEDFVQEDTLGLMQQLGAIPAPGQHIG